MKDCPQNKITPWDIKTLEALPGQLQIACIFCSGPSVIPCNYKQYRYGYKMDPDDTFSFYKNLYLL